jgi:Asp-tRNA(Asn)/Glu-tRNA(Gln) amidotransferase B subunit
MKASKGQANPALLNELVTKRLNEKTMLYKLES